jgi:CRP/FNR family transcriptional regulator, cyclic AMP receptor protein
VSDSQGDHLLASRFPIHSPDGSTGVCDLLLAHFGKEDKPEPVIAKISRDMLAEMACTTRSRASFFLNKLWRLGFIDYKERLRVHSSLLNIVLHD